MLALMLSMVSPSAALSQSSRASKLKQLCSELMEPKGRAQHHQNHKQAPSGRLLNVLSERAATPFHKDEGWRWRQSETSQKQICAYCHNKVSNKISPRPYGRLRNSHSGWQNLALDLSQIICIIIGIYRSI